MFQVTYYKPGAMLNSLNVLSQDLDFVTLLRKTYCYNILQVRKEAQSGKNALSSMSLWMVELSCPPWQINFKSVFLMLDAPFKIP